MPPIPAPRFDVGVLDGEYRVSIVRGFPAIPARLPRTRGALQRRRDPSPCIGVGDARTADVRYRSIG